MFFTKEDRKDIEDIKSILERIRVHQVSEQCTPLGDLIESMERIEQKLDLIPDVQKFCENIRQLVEYQTSNIKALNFMMTELKGIIATQRAKTKKPRTKKKKDELSTSMD